MQAHQTGGTALNAFRTNPVVRMYARAIAVGVVAYLVLVFHAGKDVFDLATFVWGLGGAIVYAIAGYLLPIEPKVGVKTDVSP
jgi:hypothetical protein